MSLDESTNVLDGVSSSNTERVQDSTRRSTPVRPAKPTSSAPSAIDYKSLLSGSEIVDAVVVPVREISDAVKVFSQFLYHPRHRCKYILNHYETVDGLGTRRLLLQAAAAADTQKTPSNDDEPVRTALSFFNEHVARKFPLWRFVSKETTVEWTHRSWGFREALREVLAAIRRDAKACTSNAGAWDDDDPDDVTTAYEQVGHLAHFNLPRSLVPYGELIGSLMLETHSNIHLVVNKERCIEDTFRTFPMRVLASRDPLASDPGWGASNGALIDFNVTVRSGGCVYSFPFDKVFWNSRLEGEHTRLIQSMCAEASLPSKSSPQAVALRDSVLFDVCAGVGPFVIPALRHFGLLEVYANDLNPHSVAALRDNLTRNKVTTSGGLQQGSIELYQLDGVEFLRSIVAPRLRTASRKDEIIPLPPTKVAHLVMNLPGSAIDLFVPALRDHLLPIVLGDVCSCREVMAHVYTFSSSSEPLDNVHQRLCACLYPYAPKTDDCIALHLVRDVAPKKVMVCASVRLSQFIRISSPSDVVEQMSDTSPRASSCFSSKRGRNEELTM